MSNVVRVLFFATFKDIAGRNELLLELPDQACVKDFKVILKKHISGLTKMMGSALVTINREFANDDEVIPHGAEIAIFPPVSGGIDSNFPTIINITEDEIDLNRLTSDVVLPSTGAVVIFTGTVRGVTNRGDSHVTDFLEYEAYLPMAQEKLRQIVNEIRTQWPLVEGIALVQRVGKLVVGTPTVAIVCSSAHRDTGVFEAARYGIDRLKEIVPIWKKEVGPHGEEWIEGTYRPKAGE
jgi:molybdopterin synthase catalytic subunit